MPLVFVPVGTLLQLEIKHSWAPPCKAPKGTNTKVTSAKGNLYAFPTIELRLSPPLRPSARLLKNALYVIFYSTHAYSAHIPGQLGAGLAQVAGDVLEAVLEGHAWLHYNTT